MGGEGARREGMWPQRRERRVSTWNEKRRERKRATEDKQCRAFLLVGTKNNYQHRPKQLPWHLVHTNVYKKQALVYRQSKLYQNQPNNKK